MNDEAKMCLVVAIIQARMGSTRLPGKTMVDIARKPLLAHIIERVKASRTIDKIVVATTKSPEDQVIVRLATEFGLQAYAGDENDVLDRFYRASKQAKATIIVRITADDPFKDPEVLDKVVEYFLDHPNLDYVSNTIKPTYPIGLDVEVFSFKALERTWWEASKLSEREHVTPYMLKYPEEFNLGNVTHNADLSHLRWTLDYEEDLSFTREVYNKLAHKEMFLMEDILKLLEKEPGLLKINQDIVTESNESLRQDDIWETIGNRKIAERITDLERAYVLEVLDSQFRTSTGNKMTKRLERKFAKVFKSNYAISFTNGTATMHAALVAAGVGPGDEVIVPPLTMASTSFAVLHSGAAPVFADIDPHTWTIDPQSVEERITPRTRAIIPVSIYGLSPDMDPLMEIAKEHGLFVLEDNAECFLGYYKGKIVGSIGHASSFSFQSSKHMTSGEGGMVVTNDEELAIRIRRFNSLGYATVGAAAGKGKITKEMIQNPDYERHLSIGWNYRMPELCAAVALGQLERLSELVEMRIKVAKLYSEAIKGCNWLIPQLVAGNCIHSYWAYVLKIENDNEFGWHDFQKKYIEYGGDGFYGAWQLTYLEPALRGMRFDSDYQQYARGLCPVAESVQPRLLQLKTNFMSLASASLAADALFRTIKYFNS